MNNDLISAFDLNGEAALVTGASSGLGQRFATVLARAGARVALAARRGDCLETLAREIEDFDGRALPIRLDVTDRANIREAVDCAETELGPLSILVNNAGLSVVQPIAEVEEADYDLIMDTNTKGAFFVAQEVGRRMIEHGQGGRIINIASVAAFRPVAGIGVYAMSKSAVVQMTRVLAREWARHNINVNAICPGYIETEINRDFFKSGQGRKLIARFPRRRVGEPEDLDGILLLLASGASRFITGSTIVIDDGQSFGL